MKYKIITPKTPDVAMFEFTPENVGCLGEVFKAFGYIIFDNFLPDNGNQEHYFHQERKRLIAKIDFDKKSVSWEDIYLRTTKLDNEYSIGDIIRMLNKNSTTTVNVIVERAGELEKLQEVFKACGAEKLDN